MVILHFVFNFLSVLASLVCFFKIITQMFSDCCVRYANLLKIGMTYGDRALLKSYLCPDLKEGSEQVKLMFCTIYRYCIALISCLLQCVADNFAHNFYIRF